jgi:hypothetical protein
MSDIQDEAYSEAMDEIARLKAEIVRLKALVTDRMYDLEEINELKSLLSRAADSLEERVFVKRSSNLNVDVADLIAELRKAAE